MNNIFNSNLCLRHFWGKNSQPLKIAHEDTIFFAVFINIRGIIYIYS